MSVDGQDGSLGDGDARAGGRTPHIPSQGGRGGTPRDGIPRGGTPAPAAGGIPAQREWHEDSALPPPVDTPRSDAVLIGRMRSGDDTAYEELYRRHAAAVRRYARTCCRDAHTADDLTAEVFARMLQAVRGGSGPEHAVRAYLLTSVRRVAASWTQSARREQLVDDFAVFATQAARTSEASDDAALDLGADVRAMHEAEQSMAMRAFRSLPERWQAVLWHTEVEEESPSEVAVLFGLDANGTRVLASRAREGLKQAYLQAHVSAGLAGDEECARHADQLGTYARRRLRTRAERGLRKHLEECAKCRLAVSQLEEVASGIPAVVPVAVVGWFGAAGYAKALGLVAGAAGAGAASTAAAAGGGSSGGVGAGGRPVRTGIAAGVVAVTAAAAAAVAFAVSGDDGSAEKPVAQPASAPPVVQPSDPVPAPPREAPAPQQPVLAATPAPPSAVPPTVEQASPPPRARSATVLPARALSPTPSPSPPPTVDRQRSRLSHDVADVCTEPGVRLGESGWVWQCHSLSVGGEQYTHGVTLQGRSSVSIDIRP
ncbi:RNA polymerase sigma factor [Streptomyces sp. HUAS ZL42]|uniref:RNA polymerase sigma factor n=1 Tax=Streptomyces sp. HUAS ZL42 TaxID=3231715 RepID=UPI00345E4D42